MVIEPFVQDADFILYNGDVQEVLRELPAESVDTCVTSPPYWGLRDYQTAVWNGGDPECSHVEKEIRTGLGLAEWSKENGKGGGHKAGSIDHITYKRQCDKCGAGRIDQQIGLEDTPQEYVETIISVFREVRRVLAPHGTVWLNLGASYAGNRSYQVPQTKHQAHDYGESNAQKVPSGYKPKDLVPIPWLVGLALQEDGWYLRSDIIWSKPNPLPESVTDRPTKAHEYVLMLSKKPLYFWDQEAVREPAEWNRWGTQTNDKYEGTLTSAGWIKTRSKFELEMMKRRSYPAGGTTGNRGDEHIEGGSGGMPSSHLAGRNMRSVWEIATQPYADAHFATFPKELPRRAILAGCPERVCTICGKPQERIAEQSEMPGFTDCGHDSWRQGIVLDPFMGSGTVALVARELDRHSVGIELNKSYCDLIADRLKQLSLFA